jgi:hypothetical protein
MKAESSVSLSMPLAESQMPSIVRTQVKDSIASFYCHPAIPGAVYPRIIRPYARGVRYFPTRPPSHLRSFEESGQAAAEMIKPIKLGPETLQKLQSTKKKHQKATFV